MTINFHLSVDQILHQIYALSAMHTYAAHHAREIPLLTPDHRKALRLLAGDSFCAVALRLGERVEECKLPEETLVHDVGDDNMDLTLRVGGSVGNGVQSVMRRSLESAVACLTLREVYAGIEPALANLYANRADAAVGKLTMLSDTPDSPLATIMPCY